MLRKVLYITAHSVFWMIFLFVALFFLYRIDQGWGFLAEYVWVFIIQVIWAVFAFYLYYFVFAKRFLTQDKLYIYLLFSIVTSVAISVVFSYIILSIYPVMQSQTGNFPYWTNTIGTFIISQMGSMVKGFLTWYNDQQKKSELQNKNLQMELSLLQQQLNPHFLFNTLNNIDSFIQHNPKMASKSILMLSDILRYLIYETKQTTVPLTKEIECLENVVKLNVLRYQKPEIIVFEKKTDQNLNIAPMLFLPFVENAFKHSSDIGKKTLVEIFIGTEGNKVVFKQKNTFNPITRKHNKNGVGLKSTKKRLELLYPKNHQLTIEESNDTYKVELTIICYEN